MDRESEFLKNANGSLVVNLIFEPHLNASLLDMQCYQLKRTRFGQIFGDVIGHKHSMPSNQVSPKTYKRNRYKIPKSNARELDHDMNWRIKWSTSMSLLTLEFVIHYHRFEFLQIFTFLTLCQYLVQYKSTKPTNI